MSEVAQVVSVNVGQPRTARGHNADVERARILLDVDDLSAAWRDWAHKALARAQRKA